MSLLWEFGSGIHLENEMLLSENGDFSYYVSINQGGKGTWKLEGGVITADFTTYEPEVREEQLTMTPVTGEDRRGDQPGKRSIFTSSSGSGNSPK